MAIEIVWSATLIGTSISSVAYGDIPNGSTTDVQDLYINVTGNINDLTAVKLYITPKTTGYAGEATANEDYAEFLAWGDNSTVNGFGGIQFNMDAVGSFPTASWPTVSSKLVASGGSDVGFVVNSSQGSNASNAVSLSKRAVGSGSGDDGVITAGSPESVNFRMRIVIPNNEDTTGLRDVKLVLTYDYTT